MDDLRAKLTDRVKFVSLAHASNVLGVVNPIKEITQLGPPSWSYHDGGWRSVYTSYED